MKNIENSINKKDDFIAYSLNNALFVGMPVWLLFMVIDRNIN